MEGPRLAALPTACRHRPPRGSQAGALATKAHPDRLRTVDVIGERPRSVKGHTSPPPVARETATSGAPAAPPGACGNGEAAAPAPSRSPPPAPSPLGSGATWVRGRRDPVRRALPRMGRARTGAPPARFTSLEAEISLPPGPHRTVAEGLPIQLWVFWNQLDRGRELNLTLRSQHKNTQPQLVSFQLSSVLFAILFSATNAS